MLFRSVLRNSGIRSPKPHCEHLGFLSVLSLQECTPTPPPGLSDPGVRGSLLFLLSGLSDSSLLLSILLFLSLTLCKEESTRASRIDPTNSCRSELSYLSFVNRHLHAMLCMFKHMTLLTDLSHDELTF